MSPKAFVDRHHCLLSFLALLVGITALFVGALFMQRQPHPWRILADAKMLFAPLGMVAVMFAWWDFLHSRGIQANQVAMSASRNVRILVAAAILQIGLAPVAMADSSPSHVWSFALLGIFAVFCVFLTLAMQEGAQREGMQRHRQARA